MTRRSNKTYGVKFEKVSVTPELLLSEAGKAILRPPNIHDHLDLIEPQCKKVLTDHGLSDRWLEHACKDMNELPDEKVYYAVRALSYIEQTRRWLHENNAMMAATQTYNMMQFVNDLNLTVMEPDIYRGKESLKHNSKGGEVRSSQFEKDRLVWQAHAKEIWKKSPSHSTSRVAQLVASRTGDSYETIRKHINHLKPKPPQKK